MVNKHLGGRLRPVYSYSKKNGLTRHRRWVWAYFPMVMILMAGAGFLAYMQAGHAQLVKPAASEAQTTSPQAAFAAAPPAPIVNDSPPLSTEDPRLASLLANWASSHHQNSWSVAVTGLSADTPSATYNSNVSYNSASIFKLLLTYPLLSKIPRSEWGRVQVNTGDTQTALADCVDAMLRVSDNTCGDAVGAYVGWAYADAQLHAMGLANTHMNNPSGPTTTATDVNIYLQNLYSSKSLDPGDRAYIMNIMQEQVMRSGIPAGCASASTGCVVADKTGDLGFVRHDCAIVQYGAKAYALSIFTNGANYNQISQLAAQIQLYISSH